MPYQPCPSCHNIYNSGKSCRKCGRCNICPQCSSFSPSKFCGNCGLCLDNTSIQRQALVYPNPYSPSLSTLTYPIYQNQVPRMKLRNQFILPATHYPATTPTPSTPFCLTRKNTEFYIDETYLTQEMIRSLEPIYKSNPTSVKIVIRYDANLQRLYPNLPNEIQNIQILHNYKPIHVFVIYLIGNNEDRNATRFVRRCLPECKVYCAYFNPYIVDTSNNPFVANIIDQSRAFYLIEPARY